MHPTIRLYHRDPPPPGRDRDPEGPAPSASAAGLPLGAQAPTALGVGGESLQPFTPWTHCRFPGRPGRGPRDTDPRKTGS